VELKEGLRPDPANFGFGGMAFVKMTGKVAVQSALHMTDLSPFVDFSWRQHFEIASATSRTPAKLTSLVATSSAPTLPSATTAAGSAAKT
jgi:hypothetical protein